MKIRMIYLAAGNSRRFGSNKLLYQIEGKPMFRYGLDALLKVLEEMEGTSLTVVTNFAEIEEYVRECGKDRISAVKSPESHKGISYSVRAGLMGSGPNVCTFAGENLSVQPDSGSPLPCADVDYYLFCVADQPCVSSKTVVRLLRETAEGGFAGGFVEWEGKSGNPAVFSKELLPELFALQGDNGGKRILTGRRDVCRVRAGRREELEDVDISCHADFIYNRQEEN